MNYIEENEAFFSSFIEDDESFDQYISRMRSDGEWGDQPELCAAAQCLHVNIYVHQVDSPRFVILCDDIATRAIHLSYHGGCHYNSIRIVDDDIYDIPARPIILPDSHPIPNQSINSCNTTNDSVMRVKECIPWVSSDLTIQSALDLADGDVDSAIEILMSNPEGLELAENVHISELKVEEPSKVECISQLETNSPPTVDTHVTATATIARKISAKSKSKAKVAPLPSVVRASKPMSKKVRQYTRYVYTVYICLYYYLVYLIHIYYTNMYCYFIQIKVNLYYISIIAGCSYVSQGER